MPDTSSSQGDQVAGQEIRDGTQAAASKATAHSPARHHPLSLRQSTCEIAYAEDVEIKRNEANDVAIVAERVVVRVVSDKIDGYVLTRPNPLFGLVFLAPKAVRLTYPEQKEKNLSMLRP
ncbi:uncharacterized protein KY384_008897 [Bacidia gigantensis]|uniref:uncharacterized protein n=1 Tax=Bacidia gigantensis TaxID=2732470 RepID=UPI001D0575F7|nr:uncharacterized protein KY384_008897 [Bacidia gigantensis]KAG8525253.1 hypothetical protein KY384_008897 [Bacidia gigantensis]